MSTRCQIGVYQKDRKSTEKNIKDFDALLYRHSDGYPSGVLPEIMPFLQWWSKGRGIADTEYLSARLLQYLCNQYDLHSIEFAKAYPTKDNEIADTKKYTGTLGHGICKVFHWDIEYYYAITTEGLLVYEVVDMENDSYKVIGFIPYDFEGEKDFIRLIKD